MAAENLDLKNDVAVLAIKSPRSILADLIKMLYTYFDERFVIVALDWDGTANRHGNTMVIRSKGNPCFKGHPTLFIYPSELVSSLLNGLP